MHRDLKPHNILLSEDSEDAEVKIADFGFAREIDPTHLMDSYLGSPLYMVSTKPLRNGVGETLANSMTT